MRQPLYNFNVFNLNEDRTTHVIYFYVSLISSVVVAFLHIFFMIPDAFACDTYKKKIHFC